MNITIEQLVRMIDHTLLKNTAVKKDIELLCSQALEYSFATVCVHPFYVGICSSLLHRTSTKVCTVIGFPHGMHKTGAKVSETLQALHDGAQEIDMVIQVGALLDGEKDIVWNDIRSVTDTAHQSGALVKVIIETCLLNTDQKIMAAELVADAGADFIKTSTGKIGVAATMPVTLVMLDAIKDYYFKTGIQVGMKPAGGISTAKGALQYLVMLHETLGNAWLDNKWFRFGASSLANDLILQLEKEAKGVYYSKDYISVD